MITTSCAGCRLVAAVKGEFPGLGTRLGFWEGVFYGHVKFKTCFAFIKNLFLNQAYRTVFLSRSFKQHHSSTKVLSVYIENCEERDTFYIFKPRKKHIHLSYPTILVFQNKKFKIYISFNNSEISLPNSKTSMLCACFSYCWMVSATKTCKRAYLYLRHLSAHPLNSYLQEVFKNLYQSFSWELSKLSAKQLQPLKLKHN